MDLTPDQAAELEGSAVTDPDGEEIGSVAEVFLNTGDDSPAWAAVEHGGGRALVPLVGARLDDGALRVAFARDAVTSAPAPTGDALDADLQDALYEHYGISDADLRDDSGFSTDRGAIRTQGTDRDMGDLAGDTGHP